MTYIRIGILILAGLVCYVSLLLLPSNRFYYLGFVPGVGLVILYIMLKRWARAQQRLERLRAAWGKRVEKKHPKWEVIRALYEATANNSEQPGQSQLDERTWHDLDMDAIYCQMDSTLTIPGQQGLYNMLHRPVMAEEKLLERERLISLFMEDAQKRERVQVILDKLGTENGNYIVDLLWGSIPANKRRVLLVNVLLGLAVIAPLTAIYRPSLALMAIFTVFTANMALHYHTRRWALMYMDTIGYLGRLLACASKLAQTELGLPVEYGERLQRLLAGTKQLRRRTALLALMQGDDVLYIWINIYLLLEVRALHGVLRFIKQQGPRLQALHEMVGLIDSLLAVASLRASLGQQGYCLPQFHSDSVKLVGDALIHPLLNEPVGNDISLSIGQGGVNGVVITGANMSGKSTYLRTIGVNAVLAQTIHTCYARTYSSVFLRVLSVIGRADNIIAGKSYYLVEAEAIKRILAAADGEATILCILDETFRGTNSLERVAASTAVLRYLIRRQCFIVAATHDLEVPLLLDNEYAAFHFSECVDATGISFDYQLKPGITQTRNAINLLRYLGYPDEIFADAMEAKERLEHKDTRPN